jgi:transposase-like protein
MEFLREFPDDKTCLDWLWRKRYSEDGEHAYCFKCSKTRKFHRVKSRPSYSCDHCGLHIHPTAGTIFNKSATSLHLWFYAMYLMTSTRCAVSAKHLERELGVTYKTAWRMANRIRNVLMDQEDEPPLSGEVEADETFFGGKPRAAETRARRRGRSLHAPQPKVPPAKRKTVVFGAVERGGRIKATVVADSRAHTLGPVVRQYVMPSSILFTDEWKGYIDVGYRYREHHRIKHSEDVYVSGNVHTNTIEGFWSNVKRGISGNYHNVSTKWLQGYLNEFCWRWNQRKSGDGRAMFEALALRAVDTALPWS